jgi:hypothetical protein
MIHDMSELRRVGRVLEEALELLKSEEKRLEQQHGLVPNGDGAAGSPMQTLYGIRLLSAGVRRQLKWVALAAGYITLGMDERADHAVEMARDKPMDIPSGADRMARPLGQATVRALEMIRDLDGFILGDIGPAIETALTAPHATFPPRDWDTASQVT